MRVRGGAGFVGGMVTAGAAVVALTSAGAHAGPDDTTTPETPPAFELFLELEGSATPPAGAPRPSPPPPVCWWEPAGALADDPTAFAEAFRATANSYGTADMIERQYMQLPHGSDSLDEAIQAEETLEAPGVTWYMLKWDSTLLEGDDYHAALEEAGCTTFRPWRGGESQVGVMYDFFEPGEEPAPRIDVAELARYAYEAMYLVPPTLQWNPRIDDVDNAALVNLPTWMWVEDPLAVADDRWIRASIGPVWARVDASPGGLSITADGKQVSCTNAQARQAYDPSGPDSSGCRLTFDRASHAFPAGFAVTASTTWQAAWTSSTGEGGTFDARTVVATTNVPVASIQSVVTQVD